MPKSIAVTNFDRFRRSIKNDLLLFDQVALVDFDFVDIRISDDKPIEMEDWEKETWDFDAREMAYLQAKSDFDWLKSNDLVIKPELPYQQSTGVAEYDQLIASLLNQVSEADRNFVANGIPAQFSGFNHNPLMYPSSIVTIFGMEPHQFESVVARIGAIAMRQLMHQDAYPLLSGSLPIESPKYVQKNIIMNVVLRQFPVISESTSFESIIEFKGDTKAYGEYLALKNWISEISKLELPRNEIEEKIEYLLHQYMTHLDAYEIKWKRDTFETVVVTGLEILEDISKFSWSSVAKKLFSIAKGRVNLMDEESKAPGSQLAYIHRVKDQDGFFSSTKP